MLITSLIHSHFSFSANPNPIPNQKAVTLEFDSDLDVSSSSTQAFRIVSSGAIWTANLAVIEEVESDPRRFLADDPNGVAGGDGNVKILNPGERKTETVHIYHLHLIIIILTMACMLACILLLDPAATTVGGPDVQW